MKASPEEIEFVRWMAALGQEDRELYRELRAEAWAIVQRRHASKDDGAKRRWLRNAS